MCHIIGAMRIFGIILLIGASFIGAVWFVPPHLEIAPAPQALEDYNGTIDIKGEVRLHLLPYPHLRLGQVSYKAPHIEATLEEVHYGLSWTQLWQTENRWRLTSIEAHGGSIVFSPPTYETIDITLGEVQESLLALPLPVLRLHNVDVVLHKVVAKSPLTLSALDATIERRENNYRFAFTLGGFTTRGEVEDISAPRTAMVLSIDSDDETEELTMVGILHQAPYFQLDTEVRFSSHKLLRDIVQTTSLNLTSDVNDRLNLSGVMSLTTEYIRAENLQTNLFGEDLQTQLNINFAEPTIKIRTASDAIDLSALSGDTLFTAAPTAPNTPHSFVYNLYHTLFTADNNLGIEFDLISNQFLLGGERGRNLIIGLSLYNDIFRLTRLSADLPFSSSAVMVGDISSTDFDGRFSLRSSDTASFLQWLTGLFEGRVASLQEQIALLFPSSGGLQRIGVVSDIKWNTKDITLHNIKGQLGDTDFSSNIELTTTPLRGQVRIDVPSMDLADWHRLIDTQNNPETWFRNIKIEPFLLSMLSALPPQADIDMRLSIDNLSVASETIGKSDINIRFAPDKIEVKRVHFADYLGASTTLSGQLQAQARRLYGTMQVALSADNAEALGVRLLPRVPFVPFDMGRPLVLEAIWRLPTPDEQDWTSGFIGTATLNKKEAEKISLDYSLRSPSRDLDLTIADSTLEMRGDGRAQDIARLFSLPSNYKRKAKGAFHIATTTQAAALSSVDAKLTLADDAFHFVGTMRPTATQSAGGYRLEGMAAAKQSAPSLMRVAYDGQAQIIATADMISFSNLNTKFGTGALSGEGSYNRKDFNATILLSDFDASPFLPRFNKRWSSKPLRWSILSDINANLEIRLERFKAAGFAIDELTGNIKWNDGVLEAAPLDSLLWGGQASLALRAEGGSLTPSFNLYGEYEKVNSGAFFTSLYDQNIMDAPISGTFEIGGRGTSTLDMLKALKGNINLTAGQGTLYKVVPTPLAFNRALAVIGIEGGVFNAPNADISFTEDESSGKFSGILDIATRQIKAQLALPSQIFLLSGDITNPTIKVETAEPEIIE